VQTRLTELRAVIFDLDDTLYPEREYVRSGYRAVAENLRGSLGVNEPFEGWLWERFLGGQSGGAFDAMSRHFDLGLSPDQVGRLVTVYREHGPDIRPYEGIEELLGELRDRLPLGMLTDGFLPAQRVKLEALGIKGFFAQVLFTEELGRRAWNPSIEWFELLQGRLDLPPASLVYVADNPAKDFIAPNRLGWATIRILLPGQVHGAETAPEGGTQKIEVRSVRELRETLLR